MGVLAWYMAHHTGQIILRVKTSICVLDCLAKPQEHELDIFVTSSPSNTDILTQDLHATRWDTLLAPGITNIMAKASL